MSRQQVLAFIQSLITMADPSNPESIAEAKSILENLLHFAQQTQKCDMSTKAVMAFAIDHFDDLMDYQSSFAGKSGDYDGNRAKLHRLHETLFSQCG